MSNDSGKAYQDIRDELIADGLVDPNKVDQEQLTRLLEFIMKKMGDVKQEEIARS